MQMFYTSKQIGVKQPVAEGVENVTLNPSYLKHILAKPLKYIFIFHVHIKQR